MSENTDRLELPLDGMLRKRLAMTERLLADWNKFYEYIKPFSECNEEMKTLAKRLRTNFILMPIDDLVLVTALTAERMSITKMFGPALCLKCGKELDDENKKK